VDDAALASREQDPTTDEALMLALGAGDPDALRRLVTRHQERVRRLACQVLGDEHAAEDAVQDVFLRLPAAALRYRPVARFTTYLYQITVNLCRDRLRRRKRRPFSLEQIQREPPAAPQQDPAERRETVLAVRRAIDALPDRQRTALILHRYENLTHDRIAEITGWSRSAVESLLVRAYARLRTTLADLL
jgi:RNA polymerase sigma-70 factor (ECF subfamily)